MQGIGAGGDANQSASRRKRCHGVEQRAAAGAVDSPCARATVAACVDAILLLDKSGRYIAWRFDGPALVE